MKFFLPRALALGIGVSLGEPADLAAQGTLFTGDSVIAVTLRADFRTLFRDRDPDTSIWRGGTLRWAGADSAHTVPLQLRTRGVFRLRTCDVPPIRLRFEPSDVRRTPFSGARRPKLVTHCKNRGDYEQFVLQEYAIYRVYQLFTPMSFGARLLRVTYEDSAGAVRQGTRYGYLTEDPNRLADRVGGTEVERQGVRQADLDPAHAALLGVFQYFVANTDWSVPGLHNVALVEKAGVIYPVPFDFDWSGVIDAPYAQPAPQLGLRTVRERRYRGMCQDPAILEPVLARFEALRDSITAIYRAVPGLEARNANVAIRYYDDFFQDIRDRPRFLRTIARECMRS